MVRRGYLNKSAAALYIFIGCCAVLFGTDNLQNKISSNSGENDLIPFVTHSALPHAIIDIEEIPKKESDHKVHITKSAHRLIAISQLDYNIRLQFVAESLALYLLYHSWRSFLLQ